MSWELPRILGCESITKCPSCKNEVDPTSAKVNNSPLDVYSSLGKSTCQFQYMVCSFCESDIGVDGRADGLLILPRPRNIPKSNLQRSQTLPTHYAFTHELMYNWKDNFILGHCGYYDFWRLIIAGYHMPRITIVEPLCLFLHGWNCISLN